MATLGHTIENRLARALLEAGLLDEGKLKEILEKRSLEGQRTTLADCFIQGKVIDPALLIQAMGKVFNLPVVQLRDEPVDSKALALVSETLVRRHHVLPVRLLPNDALLVVTADPFNMQAVADLRTLTRKRIELALAPPKDLEDAINLHFRATQHIAQDADEASEASLTDDGDETTSLAALDAISQKPIVRTVEALITQAVKDRASDIHIEPQPDKVVVRYRVDGILREVVTLPISVHEQMIARLKVLAKLNPTERRHPQDGQFSTKVDEQRLDIRLATAESIHGETAVLRLLNRAGSLLSLPDLGFAPGTLERHQRMLRHPFGMVLIAGPTGAGKTTTLYASLGQLDRAERNIVTIEDPVEYRFEGITQLQVSQRHGISFATGLRAIMRMDPDVIMVGEIRDGETAQIAVQAALTGHLVLSSIHANDAAGAIFRLLNLGADTFMVSAALLGVVAQRMVRKVCPYCAKEQEADAESQALFAEVLQEQRSVFKQGAGCSMCTGTGYRGRTGIFELLETSETLEEMLLARAPAAEIRRQAIAKGMVTMLQDGMRKAAEGVTTPAEVVRHVYSAAGSRRT